MWGKVFMRQRRNVCTAVPRRSAQEAAQRRIAWTASSANTLLQTKQKEYGLTLVGFVTPQEKELYWHAPKAFTEGWQEARTRIDWTHVARATFGSLLWATDDADYVIGVLAIDGGKTGYLITAESIGQGLLAKLERISKGFEEYAQLKQLKSRSRFLFCLFWACWE